MTWLRNHAGALVLGIALVLGGCSAPAAQQSSTPATRHTAPQGGQLLRDRGITHGPVGFSLPVDLPVSRTIDQPNVVTLVFAREDGPRVKDYLDEHRGELGLEQVRMGKASMTFVVDGWVGGLATSADIAGLTLRRQA